MIKISKIATNINGNNILQRKLSLLIMLYKEHKNTIRILPWTLWSARQVNSLFNVPAYTNFSEASSL